MPAPSFHLRIVLAAALAVTGVLLALATMSSSQRGSAQAALASRAPLRAAAAVPTPAAAGGQAALTADTSASPAAPRPTIDAARERVVARPCERANLTVNVPRDLPVRSAPGAGRLLGAVPTHSRYLGASMRTWVREVSPNGRYGRVDVPWAWPQRGGWIRLTGLQRDRASVTVRASLGRRELRVMRGCRVALRVPMAVGAASSPSPRGRFYVTDLVPVPRAQSASFGSFAFGISTIQPNTPPGWTGGNQMAIHGTGDPRSIGTAASAGCLRVSEATLARLRELLHPGTPVIIEA